MRRLLLILLFIVIPAADALSQETLNDRIARDAQDGAIDGQIGAPSGGSGDPLADAIIRLLLDQAPRIARSTNPLQQEYNTAAIEFPRELVAGLLGTWEGSYVCRQGKTGMTLKLDYLSDRSVQGTFEFYSVAGGARNVPRGSYAVRLLVGPKNLFLEPLRWINQPDDYTMVGLSGAMSKNGQVLAGEVQANGCDNWKAAKTAAAD